LWVRLHHFAVAVGADRTFGLPQPHVVCARRRADRWRARSVHRSAHRPLAAAVAVFLLDRHLRSRCAPRPLLGPLAPVLFGAANLIHAFTIVVIWSIGQAQGVVVPVFDCAVLFIVMMRVALVPISVGGWGPSRAGGGIAPGRPWPCAMFRTGRYD
jgi:hypothetical protein